MTVITSPNRPLPIINEETSFSRPPTAFDAACGREYIYMIERGGRFLERNSRQSRGINLHGHCICIRRIAWGDGKVDRFQK